MVKWNKRTVNNASIVLFGNKCDLDNELWEVSKEEAIQFAQDKNLPFFEASAKYNIGIKEGFENVVNTAYEKYEGSVGVQLKKKILNQQKKQNVVVVGIKIKIKKNKKIYNM